ncbi:MAG TPA: haloacid dehalogenase [Actinomycetota bacterium]|nr:haloacid dehalogenase [Actinomycetota bacterium]
MPELNEIQEQIRDRFDRKSAGRELALQGARRTIRSCANAIRAIHRHEWDTALERIAEAEASLREAEDALRPFPEIFFAGFLQDAQIEYVEARCTYAILREEPFPSHTDLQIMEAPYLNGLGDTVGELRRHILDLMRHGELERCEQLLQAMDDLYVVMTSMDYPDAITGGLRRRADVARSLLERTRGEFSIALIQQRLEARLAAHADRLRESGA